jgi:hypothetical protein
LNGIVKLSSIDSIELHISKLAPFSRNHGIPKIKSDPGQSGPRTINSRSNAFMLLAIVKANTQINLS